MVTQRSRAKKRGEENELRASSNHTAAKHRRPGKSRGHCSRSLLCSRGPSPWQPPLATQAGYSCLDDQWSVSFLLAVYHTLDCIHVKRIRLRTECDAKQAVPQSRCNRCNRTVGWQEGNNAARLNRHCRLIEIIDSWPHTSSVVLAVCFLAAFDAVRAFATSSSDVSKFLGVTWLGLSSIVGSAY